MAANKFYAVRAGRTPGIYFTWDDCKAQVDKFPNAEFKKFGKIEEAYAFMTEPQTEKQAAPVVKSPEPAQERPQTAMRGESEGPVRRIHGPDKAVAFVDGSFNKDTGVYGYGGFLSVGSDVYPLMGHGNDPKLSSMHNVAGEISGSMAAVRKAEELGVKELKVLYDYAGIEQWANGEWKAGKPATADYKAFMTSPERTVSLSFEHVQAHTGIEGNEMADVMAKHSVGLRLSGAQQQLLDKALAMGGNDMQERSGPSMDVEMGG